MATENLLPLLSQLQCMENTITNFMLETILKLQSLTDVKVFLLIDSGQKRRYCGSKNLMDTFESKKGLFCSSDTDIAIHLDPTANALIESPPPNSNSSALNKDSFDHGTFSTATMPIMTNHTSSVEPLALEAPATALEGPSFPIPKVGWKAKSHDNPTTSLMHVEFEDSTKVKRAKLDEPGTDDVSSYAENENTCKIESHDIEAESAPEYVVSDEEEDDYAPVSFLMDDTNVSISPFDAWMEQRGNDTMESNKTPYPSIEPLEFFDKLSGNDLEVHKYKTLMTVENTVALYQKGTIESKLLKSVCYSVGKNAALKCPYPFTTENKRALMSHWSHHCDLFVGQCANAGLLVKKNQNNTPLLNLIPRMSAVGFIRQSIRDGFKKVSKQCQKKAVT